MNFGLIYFKVKVDIYIIIIHADQEFVDNNDHGKLV